MELVGQNHRRLHIPRFAIQLQLPLYLRLMFSLVVSMMVIVAGVMTFTRLMQPPANPFAPYADILPGHPKEVALERGFTCFTNVFDDGESCSRRDEPASPLFSAVHLSTLGDRIHTLGFTTSVNTLTLGDLVLLWGRPDIQLRGYVAQMQWPSPNVTALAVLSSGRPLNHFTPVAYIAFTAF